MRLPGWLPYLTHGLFTLAVGLVGWAAWRADAGRLGLVALLVLATWAAGRRWRAGRHIAFSLLVGLSGVGAFGGQPLWMMLTALLCALSAWDLAGWQARWPGDQPVEEGSRWLRRHLGRLGGIWGLSLGLFVLTQQVELQLGVWSALVLGVLLLLGLSQTTRLLRRPSS